MRENEIQVGKWERFLDRKRRDGCWKRTPTMLFMRETMIGLGFYAKNKVVMNASVFSVEENYSRSLMRLLLALLITTENYWSP
jgi:hypothetical protein